jgi:hypothetical protein
LREERLKRLRRHGDVIDVFDFEKFLEMDDFDEDRDLCYSSVIGPAMMQISSYLPKYRSSWSVSPTSPPLCSFGSRVCIAGSSEICSP